MAKSFFSSTVVNCARGRQPHHLQHLHQCLCGWRLVADCPGAPPRGWGADATWFQMIPMFENTRRCQGYCCLMVWSFFFFHHGFTTSSRHLKIGIVEILCHLESTSTNHQRPVVQLAPCRSQTWPSSAQWWVPAQQALDGGSIEHNNSSKFYSFFGYDELLGI